MEAVQTVLNYPNIVATFVEPDNSGLAVLDYEIVFFDKAQNGYRTEVSLCDGTDATVISSHTCSFSVADVITQLSYERGDLLLIKARARNNEGFGQFSSPNSSGARIETVPAVMNDPQVSVYTKTTITLIWSPLVFNSETGASPITSYSLEWDQGTGSFVSLVGDPSLSVALTHQVTGLTTGTAYQFRLRAKNKHGWGEYSSTISAKPAGPPDPPAPVVTSIDNIYVRFSWSEPANNGAEITGYYLWILKADGFTLLQSESCDSSADPLIVQNRECLVEMAELTDASLYNLPQGRLVSAKI